MRERKRTQNRQSARLYLRNRDHREVVFNDVYHNVIYAEQVPFPNESEEDAEKQTGIFWTRYPKRYFYANWNVTMGGVSTKAQIVVDIERQMVYGYGAIFGSVGGRAQFSYRLRDIFVIGSQYSGSESDTYFFNALDGIRWKRTNGNLVTSRNYRYGQNGLVYIGVDASTWTYTFRIKQLHVAEDGSIFGETTQVSKGGMSNTCKYIMPISDGAIFQYNDSNFIYYFKITGYGEITNISDTPLPKYSMSFEKELKYCRKGSFSVGAYVKVDIRYPYYPMHLWVFGTSDNGQTLHTWSPIQLDYTRSWNIDTDIYHYRLFERNGYFYLMCSIDYGKTYAWKSANGIDWYEMNLPKYLDVLTVSYGGYLTEDVPESYRIIFDPNAPTTDYTINAYELLNNEELFYFEDGEYGTKADYTQSEYLVLHNNSVYFYIDNVNFLDSENNFCFKCANVNRTAIPDTLMEGDYCVPSQGHLYPYWNPTFSYQIGNIVSYGVLWKCISANTNVPPTESIYWTKYKGE